MSKEITKAFVLQEITDKLKLRELTREKFVFSETVIPIYDINNHLLHREVKYFEVNITSASNFMIREIPQHERWTFNRYDVILMGPTYTVAGINVGRGTANTIYLDLAAAQSVSYHVELSVPVILDPGNKINVNIDGYTSAQYLRLYLDYTVEDIR